MLQLEAKKVKNERSVLMRSIQKIKQKAGDKGAKEATKESETPIGSTTLNRRASWREIALYGRYGCIEEGRSVPFLHSSNRCRDGRRDRGEVVGGTFRR